MEGFDYIHLLRRLCPKNRPLELTRIFERYIREGPFRDWLDPLRKAGILLAVVAVVVVGKDLRHENHDVLLRLLGCCHQHHRHCCRFELAAVVDHWLPRQRQIENPLSPS